MPFLGAETALRGVPGGPVAVFPRALSASAPRPPGSEESAFCSSRIGWDSDGVFREKVLNKYRKSTRLYRCPL